MADIAQTAANVLRATPSQVDNVIAGETIVAGDVLYLDSATSTYKKAAHTAVATAAAVGIALCGGGDGQPIVMLTSGSLNPGGTVVLGAMYCVSTNAGKFAVDLDVGSGDYKTTLGIGTTTSNIEIDIQVSGVAIP